MRTVGVSQCLDRKLIIFGYEVFDILAIFLVLSILNYIFGETSLKLFLVWLPTVALAGILKYGKRGKPEKYLLHLVRFQFTPKELSAFTEVISPLPPKLLSTFPKASA